MRCWARLSALLGAVVPGTVGAHVRVQAWGPSAQAVDVEVVARVRRQRAAMGMLITPGCGLMGEDRMVVGVGLVGVLVGELVLALMVVVRVGVLELNQLLVVGVGGLVLNLELLILELVGVAAGWGLPSI